MKNTTQNCLNTSYLSCNVNGEPAVNEANCYVAPFNISLKEIFKALIG